MRKAVNILLVVANLAYLSFPPQASYAQVTFDKSAMPGSMDGDNTISLDLKGMDVVEVLKTLATKKNMNLVVGANVRGRVTMFLKDVNVDDAFELILVSNELAADKRGEIIYILTQREYEMMYGDRYGDKKEAKVIQLKYVKASDVEKVLTKIKSNVGRIITDDASGTIVLIDGPKTLKQMTETIGFMDEPTETFIYELKYGVADDVKAKVEPMLTKNLGTINIDERTNKVIITDSHEVMLRVKDLIEAFDSQPLQVLIEAKIIQVSLDDEYKMGIDWTSVFSMLQKEISIRNVLPMVSTGGFAGAELLIGTLGQGEFATLIQLLKKIGDTNSLSSPRITVLNNQEAKILVGTNQPYATSTVTQGSSTTTNSANVTFVEVGVKLFVTPTINRDGFVTIKIKPEVSNKIGDYPYISGEDKDGNAVTTSVPIVSSTQAETTVTIKDGYTIIIGGLISDERGNITQKIPVLGDIPVIKYGFRNEDNTVKKKELVIFLTPHIISGATDIIESPMTSPVGEDRFTLRENAAFERRDRKELNPTMFKDEKHMFDKKKELGAGADDADGYFLSLRDMIMDKLVIPEGPMAATAGDRAKIMFTLYSGGNLAKTPEVLDSTNVLMENAAKLAVQKAMPFPRFPDSIKESTKTFIIDVVYDPDAGKK